MATDISICSDALLLNGGDSINSFSDETREANVCGALFEDLVKDLITDHPWRFTMAQAQLAQLADTPLYGYDYAYQLPSDFVHLKSVENSIPYEIFENHLYCNYSEVKITYQMRPVTPRWPAYFVHYVKLELASLLAVALSEDKVKADLWATQATRQRRKARNKDSQQHPSGSIPEHNHVLTQVRQ